jgi:hypothetical protein
MSGGEFGVEVGDGYQFSYQHRTHPSTRQLMRLIALNRFPRYAATAAEFLVEFLHVSWIDLGLALFNHLSLFLKNRRIRVAEVLVDGVVECATECLCRALKKLSVSRIMRCEDEERKSIIVTYVDAQSCRFQILDC